MSSTTAADAPLAGRTALITGASRGIGAECARALAAAGARLVLLSRDMPALHAMVEELRRKHAAAFSIDLAHPDVVGGALRKVRAHLGGPPDIIVNNAGQFAIQPAHETSVDDFQRTLTVNLTSQFAIVREFLPDLRARASGDVVTIGSIADHVALPGNAAYAASKFGVRALHEVLREELRGTGVRATLVSPGPVDTTLWDVVNPDERPGFTPRARMLGAVAVADAVRWVVTRPRAVNVDELRLSRA